MMFIVVILALGTAVYGLVVASFAWEDLALGLGLTAVLLAFFHNVLVPKPLPSNLRVLKAIAAFPLFAALAVLDIIRGTWLVASIVVGWRRLEHPGIVKVPIGRRSKASAGVAGIVMTLSPGTFLVAMDWEAGEMLVHAIDASDPDTLRESYEAFYERVERHVVP